MTESAYLSLSEAIEGRFDSGDCTAQDDRCSRALIGVAIDASRLAKVQAPPEALDTLRSAERYLEGDLTSAQLAQLRMRLWRYLESRSCDVEDPEVNAVRLAQCATFDTWERGHLFDTLLAIRDFALAVSIPEESLAEILRQRFGELLTD